MLAGEHASLLSFSSSPAATQLIRSLVAIKRAMQSLHGVRSSSMLPLHVLKLSLGVVFVS